MLMVPSGAGVPGTVPGPARAGPHGLRGRVQGQSPSSSLSARGGQGLEVLVQWYGLPSQCHRLAAAAQASASAGRFGCALVAVGPGEGGVRGAVGGLGPLCWGGSLLSLSWEWVHC